MQKYEHDGPPLFSYKGKEIQAAEIIAVGKFGGRGHPRGICSM